MMRANEGNNGDNQYHGKYVFRMVINGEFLIISGEYTGE